MDCIDSPRWLLRKLPRRKWTILLLSLCVFDHILRVCAQRVHFVYVGQSSPQQDSRDPSIHHHQLLSEVHDGSLTAAEQSMLYSYKHALEGFAALLTDDQAATLRGIPGVLKVFPSRVLKIQTTRTWDFLDLHEASLIHFSPWNTSKSNFSGRSESEIIIGSIDTGTWPESASFQDDGMPPVPSRWKGICQEGEAFTTSNCNRTFQGKVNMWSTADNTSIPGLMLVNISGRKLIGARYYTKGLLAYRDPDIVGWIWGYKSARDITGHGTHTASIATGRIVDNASYRGLANGSARGGALSSRLAVYKACWDRQCYEEDVLAAIEDAIVDGVDLLSLSVAASPPQPPYTEDAIAVGAFRAMQQGLLVICAVGNVAGDATVTNAAPWILSVGASSIDRTFSTAVVLGNNSTVEGVSLNFASQRFTSLVFGGDANLPSFSSDQAGACLDYSLDPIKVKGKLVVCKHPVGYPLSKEDKCSVVKKAGGVGMILIDEVNYALALTFPLPTAVVSSSAGQKILRYINSTRRSPVAKILLTETRDNVKPAPQVASFSSKGPNIVTPDILKPDLIAPGVNVLAAWSPYSGGLKYNVVSGTSMACPHVTATAVLVKAAHPTWSPAAIKSALMTSASVSDKDGGLLVNSATKSMASPFDYGSGNLQPLKAIQPGLIYDISVEDYVLFLCKMGYDSKDMNVFTSDFHPCPSPNKLPGLFDLNYPALAISQLKHNLRLKRRVRNVGPLEKTTYRATVQAPVGVEVKVVPSLLTFTSVNETLPFSVHFKQLRPLTDKFHFGLLTWDNGEIQVRSPISVTVPVN